MHELEFTGERVVPGKVDGELFLEHVSRYQFAARFVRGRQVLDFGCGSGYGAGVLRRAGARKVVGSDLSAAAVLYATDRYGGAGTGFCATDCELAGFRDHTFDVVVSFELIEHLKSYRRFLAEVRRIVRPGGLFVLSTPNKRTYRAEVGAPPNPFHVHEFTLDELRHDLGEHFPAVEVYGQSRTEGVFFFRGADGDGRERGIQVTAGEAEPTSPHTLESATYFIAVCGDGEMPAALAPGEDSFLIAETDAVRKRELRILELQDELIGRTRWARQIEDESSRRGRRILELQEELEERTRWAKQLEEESESRVRRVLELQAELEERLRWATELDKEREERGRRIVELQKELDLLAHATRGLAGMEERQESQIAAVEAGVRAELAEVRRDLDRRRELERELAETLRWQRDSLIQQRRDLDEHDGVLAGAGRRSAELRRALERQRGAVDGVARELRALSRRIDRYQEELAAWKPQALEIEVAARRARELVDLLWSSRSWRAFTWLRRLVAPVVARPTDPRPIEEPEAAPGETPATAPAAAPAAAPEPAKARRALVVDHRLPTPDQDAGSVRMVELLRLLQALGYEVTFLPANLYAMEPYFSQLRALDIEVVVTPRVSSLTEYLTAHGDRFELAIVSRLHIARDCIDSVRALCPNAKLVFDTVDLQYLRLGRQADLEGDSELHAEAAQTRMEELGIAARVDATVVVSDVERELLLGELPELKVHRVSLIHDIAADVPGFDGRQGFFFVGGYEHPPNVDAVHWFVREVMPEVRRELPDAHFDVVGSKAPESIHALEGHGVRIRGHVDDLTPLLRGSLLSVAPLRYGAGIKGKVTQSLAWGLPVVVTNVAAEGMGLTHGVDAMIADEPAEFARAIVELHRDRALWERLSAAGRARVEDRFSLAAARGAVVGLLDALGLSVPNDGKG